MLKPIKQWKYRTGKTSHKRNEENRPRTYHLTVICLGRVILSFPLIVRGKEQKLMHYPNTMEK